MRQVTAIMTSIATSAAVVALVCVLGAIAAPIPKAVATQLQPQAVAGRTCAAVHKGTGTGAAPPKSQTWTLDAASGQLKSGNGMCLTSPGAPTQGGLDLSMQPCAAAGSDDAGAAQLQSWRYDSSTKLLTMTSETSACVNLKAYGTAPGSVVWVYSPCSAGAHGDCKGNCDWGPPGARDGITATELVNSESGLCLDDGLGPPPPPQPRTCAPGSVAAGMDFCDATQSFEVRAAALVANLTLQEKLDSFMLTQMLKGIPRLNVKQFSWDSTDISGVDPEQSRHRFPQFNMTAYPVAIAHGAMWDRELVSEISAITAVEARVLRELYYNASGGTFIGATSFDGGPLANVAYDPRVGRTAEMYSEDPYHSSEIGVAATLSLQNRTELAGLDGSGSSSGDYFLQTSQVTRHFLTDHGSRPDNNAGNYTGQPRWLEDEYLPSFEAFQVTGQAEGIMFSISALNGMASVTNEFLYGKLKDTWKTPCIRQTDCCGTFNQAVSVHHNFNSTEDAVVAAIQGGIQLDYGDSLANDISNALSSGKLTQSDFDAAVVRAFVTRFRLGEFDEAPRNPFLGYDASLLDSAAHRLSARKAMAAATVLLQNNNSVLPISLAGSPRKAAGGVNPLTIAVVGPFAQCDNRDPGYDGKPCYLHSYNGQPAYISTILDAIQEEAAAATAHGQNVTVTWAPGGVFVGPVNQTAIDEAVAVAKGADIVVVAVGLGNKVENEGLDRTNVTLPTPQLELFEAVAAAVASRNGASSLVLVLNSGGGVDVDTTKADAIVQAWYGGQETGHGLCDVLFGRVSPSGRLPLTVHRQSYLPTVGPVNDLDMVFPTTGRTYRWSTDLERDAIFTFGWGMSYTSWHYSKASATVASGSAPNVTVGVQVANTGSMDAAEVAQLYVSVPAPAGASGPPPPTYALAGFEKVSVAPGQATMVTFSLGARQLSAVMADGSRVTPKGTYTVSIAGHMPADPRAAVLGGSNVVTATFVL